MDNSNFFSLDRLIEFGLSMAVANQMIGMMNQSMQNMFVAGSQMQYNIMPQNIYVAPDGNKVGPLTASSFNDLISQGKINKDTLAWIPGMTAWQPISSIPELLKIIALTPPPL